MYLFLLVIFVLFSQSESIVKVDKSLFLWMFVRQLRWNDWTHFDEILYTDRVWAWMIGYFTFLSNDNAGEAAGSG